MQAALSAVAARMYSASVFEAVCDLVNGNPEIKHNLPVLPNFKRLGSGSFSEVYAHTYSHDRAIKVGVADDGWLGWALFCIKHEHLHNPLLPVIYNLRVFNRYYVAEVERLHSTVGDYFGRLNYDEDLVNPFTTKKVLAVCEAFDMNMRYVGCKDYMNYILDEDYCRYVSELKDLVRCSRMRLNDVQINNIMVHRDGRVVMTDPCSYLDHFSYEELDRLGYVERTASVQFPNHITNISMERFDEPPALPSLEVEKMLNEDNLRDEKCLALGC